MSLTEVSAWASHGGTLKVYDHFSNVTNCNMQFAVYTPPQAEDGPVPVVWYLSGLTCTWANVMEKSGIQKHAAEHGVMIIAPDTSPRGNDVPDAEGYDLGQGAGFYLTATQAPWDKHYKMDDYITVDLPWILAEHFPKADLGRQGIMGHSMGGHGAITLHLKNMSMFRTCSAFAPILSPARVPWGKKALKTYLGPASPVWEAYDATELVQKRQSPTTILIDQGEADQFLTEQLDGGLFLMHCRNHGQAVSYRFQPGYDHSYYFISSFMADHIAHHASVLKK
ncbi:MAG: S-formylglutathione hydrolase [Pseudomonadota bacterium]